MNATAAILFRYLRRSWWATAFVFALLGFSGYGAVSITGPSGPLPFSAFVINLSVVCFLVAVIVGANLRGLSAMSLAYVAPGYRVAEGRAALALMALFTFSATVLAVLGGARALLFLAVVIALQAVGLWGSFANAAFRVVLSVAPIVTVLVVLFQPRLMALLAEWGTAVAVAVLAVGIGSVYSLMRRAMRASEYGPGEMREEQLQVVGLPSPFMADQDRYMRNVPLPTAWVEWYTARRIRRALHAPRQSGSERPRLLLGYFGGVQDHWLVAVFAIWILVLGLLWLIPVTARLAGIVLSLFAGNALLIGLQWHSGNFFHQRYVLGRLWLLSGSESRAAFLAGIGNAYLSLLLRHGVVLGALVATGWLMLPGSDWTLLERLFLAGFCLLLFNGAISMGLGCVTRLPVLVLDGLALLLQLLLLAPLILAPAQAVAGMVLLGAVSLLYARRRWRQSQLDFA